jgi:hypothetical protein
MTMAMGWLKGLVAPAAFGDNAQPPLPGMPQPGGPPVGGMPPQGAPGGPAPYDASALPNAMQWSTGTRTQGSAGAVSPAASTMVGDATPGASGGSAEARIAQLQHDVDSLALFARTLLTMLEDSKVVTRAQFDATKNRLDMLDGKLDDR